MASPPQPQGPTFVPISLNSDTTDPITGDTTVNFTATLSDQSEPDLTLSFFEMQGTASSSPTFLPITVSNPPTPTWNGSVASFALPMNSSIFSQLSSTQTNFAVKATANGRPSWGMCVLAISL